jgi:hypothetical protein
MKHLSHHTGNLCELLTSLLIRGIQMGEISELGLLIGLVKHVIDMGRFLVFPRPTVTLKISKNLNKHNMPMKRVIG